MSFFARRKPSVLSSFLKDSQYGANYMEQALKDAFGVGRSLFDWPGSSSLGEKVAVTSTMTGTLS